MQETWATHLAVAGTPGHSREDELVLLREDHDPVSLCLAFFALCTFAVLLQLLDLNGSFHHSENLLLRVVVVVVGKVLVLDLERRFGGGRLGVPSDD